MDACGENSSLLPAKLPQTDGCLSLDIGTVLVPQHQFVLDLSNIIYRYIIISYKNGLISCFKILYILRSESQTGISIL